MDSANDDRASDDRANDLSPESAIAAPGRRGDRDQARWA